MTAAELARRRATRARMREQVFYIGMAVASASLLFAGFARSFYLRPYFRPEALAPIFVVHGVVFTSWFAILILQTALVAAGRTDLHRRVGVAGAAVAGGMVLLGPIVAIHAARRGMDLSFLPVPLFDILIFGILVAFAIERRKETETHKRLMLVATISIFPPAIARLPTDFFAGALEVFGVTDLILVACIAWDTAVRRRLHPAYLWGGLLVIVTHPLRVWLGETDAWLRLARWLIAI